MSQSDTGQKPEDTNPAAPAASSWSNRAYWHPWDVAIAILVLAGLYGLISRNLRLGPVWFLPGILIALIAALIVAHFRNRGDIARRLALVLAAVGSLAVEGSAAILVLRLIDGNVSAPYLLRDASLLWLANIIVFSLWYWELDGGGPAVRHRRGYQATDLLFPQTGLGGDFSRNWTPEYADYLFVSFNASAAFSPTDTMFLSIRVKLLMMAQALTSLVLLAVVAARAINILD